MKLSALTAVAATAAVVAGSAAAGSWGAVGFGPGGAYGWAHSYGTEQEAYNAVQSSCGWDCTQVKTFYNTCGAIAAGSNLGWGWGYAGSRAQAEGIAMNYCDQYDYGCYVRAWACSF